MNQPLIGLPGGPPDVRRSRTLALLKACEDICSLSIPPFANQREEVLRAASYIEALKQLMDAAEGIDPLRALCVLLIQRGAESGLEYTETLELFLDAFNTAAQAHAATIGAANEAAERGAS